MIQVERDQCLGFSKSTGSKCRKTVDPSVSRYCTYHTVQGSSRDRPQSIGQRCKPSIKPISLQVRKYHIEQVELVQCQGIAKSSGQKCKLRVNPSVTRFCHYHSSQKTLPITSFKSSESSNTNQYQKGFIYVYTLKHLIESNAKEQSWLKLQHIDIKAPKDKLKDPKSLDNFNPKKHILIKVGLTTKTVAKRIDEWESKCKHKLVIVRPKESQTFDDDSENSLIKVFKKLRVKETKNLKNYIIAQDGFHSEKRLGLVEKQIHSKLRKEFGHGDMICYGCKEKQGDYGIHIEWFMIPRNEIDKVFNVIDETITTMNKV